MRKATMLGVGLLVVIAIPIRADDKEKKDTSKLIGAWTVSAEEKDGKQETAQGIQGKQVKITRDTITCTTKDGKTDMAASYEIDASRTPWTITMTGTEGEHKGKTVKGIVELQDDTLKICFAEPGGETPTSFKTKDQQCCKVLKRQSGR
jgi:uncharacterized protein (TIGR03067 family)